MSEQHCRVCGCTDEAACPTPIGPCYWVRPDLCSACAWPVPRLDQVDVETIRGLAHLGLELDGTGAMFLLGALELVLKDPRLGDPVREYVGAMVTDLVNYLAVTPKLKAMTEWGFMVGEEETVQEIILPRGFQR